MATAEVQAAVSDKPNFDAGVVNVMLPEVLI